MSEEAWWKCLRSVLGPLQAIDTTLMAFKLMLDVETRYQRLRELAMLLQPLGAVALALPVLQQPHHVRVVAAPCINHLQKKQLIPAYDKLLFETHLGIGNQLAWYPVEWTIQNGTVETSKLSLSRLFFRLQTKRFVFKETSSFVMTIFSVPIIHGIYAHGPLTMKL